MAYSCGLCGGHFFVETRSLVFSELVNFRSEYGLAGHTENSGVLGSVKDLVEEVTVHSVEQVIKGMKVWSVTNEWFNVSMDSVKVWRLNFPHLLQPGSD